MFRKKGTRKRNNQTKREKGNLGKPNNRRLLGTEKKANEKRGRKRQQKNIKNEQKKNKEKFTS